MMIQKAAAAGMILAVFSSFCLGFILFRKRKFTAGLVFLSAMALFSNYALRTKNDTVFSFFLYLVTGLACIGTGLTAALIVNGVIALFRPDSKTLRNRLTYTAILVSLLVMTYGFISAKTLKINKYNVVLDKMEGRGGNKKIALISDIHLGRIVKPGRLRKIAEKVNSLNPDIIVIDGDLFDKGTDYMGDGDNKELTEILKTFTAKDGVYFVSGNHDDGSNPGDAERIVEKAGIKVLRNEEEEIDNTLTLFGVEDRSVLKIKVPAEKKLPRIILAHQPEDNKSFKNGDLVLSGHTHNGQIFPANILLKDQWVNMYGYKEYNGYKSIVSSGAGYWGIPFRLLTDSEIAEINLQLK